MKFAKGFAIAAAVWSPLAFAGAPRFMTDALVHDYAATNGVSLGEAKRELAIQEEAGRLQQTLMQREADNFAGLYIEHRPRYRIVVKFVRDAEVTLRRYTRDKTFESEVAPYSLSELRDAEAATGKELIATNIPFQSGIDLHASKVRVGVKADVSTLKRSSVAPSIVEFHHQDAFIQPTIYAAGGDYIKSNERRCTAGFSVVSASDRRGLATAAHCGDGLMTTNLIPLAKQDSKNAGSYDVQWLWSSRIQPQPTFYTGSANLYVRGTYPSTMLVVGAQVCKFGWTTRNTCGLVVDLYSQSNYNGAVGTYVQVHHPNNYQMTLEGDSGGPVYVGNYAAGIVHGRGADGEPTEHDLFFEPIETLGALGVSVMLQQF
ncbi:S1 family peptidase [Cognatilysobacter terrigena]|uniref:S1 family peptidase n=1 Tax=Cognatilysobacter terrigena TaxID=2488749 RepID=UPI001414FADA|nr:S1 family peptidase [Lysobacter terrigena]